MDSLAFIGFDGSELLFSVEEVEGVADAFDISPDEVTSSHMEYMYDDEDGLGNSFFA